MMAKEKRKREWRRREEKGGGRGKGRGKSKVKKTQKAAESVWPGGRAENHNRRFSAAS